MHCIPFAFLQCFMHLDVCLYVENYVLIGLDWVEPMMQFFLNITCSCIFHAYVPFLFYLLILCYDGAFLFVFRIVSAWHPSANPLRLGTLFILGHLPLILLLFTFSSVMRRFVKTSRRTSPNVAFIRNAAWFYRTFLILLHPLSFTVGDGNLYMIYPWVVPLWS